MMYSRLIPPLVILSRVDVASALATDEPPIVSVFRPFVTPQPLLGAGPLEPAVTPPPLEPELPPVEPPAPPRPPAAPPDPAAPAAPAAPDAPPPRPPGAPPDPDVPAVPA